MANNHDLLTLLRGNDSWRARRSTEIFKPDFSNEKIKEKNFDSLDFEYANFNGCELQSILFTDCKLRRIRLDSGVAEFVRFFESNIRESRIRYSKVMDCEFVACNMWGVYLSGSTFVRCKFRDCSFRFSKFGIASFQDCVFENCDFSGADMSEVTGISQADLNASRGDEETKIPRGSSYPSRWPKQNSLKLDDEISPLFPNRKVEVLPTYFDGALLTKAPSDPLFAGQDAHALFDRLKEQIQQLVDRGGIDNYSKTLWEAIRRFYMEVQQDSSSLDEVKFGIEASLLERAIDAQREDLERHLPEKKGCSMVLCS